MITKLLIFRAQSDPVSIFGFVKNTPSSTPPQKPQSNEAEYTTYLNREQVWEGPIPYAGYVPSSLPLNGTANWLMNPNQFPIAIVLPRHTSAECFKQEGSITLGFNARTTEADMEKLFGLAHPQLPVAAVACVFAGTNVPNSIGLTVDYNY